VVAMVTCPQCGAPNAAGDKFCASCGISLTQKLNISSQPLPVHVGQPVAPPSGVSTPSQGFSVVPSAPLAGTMGMGPLLPGVALQSGRYLIDRALGGGGMGSVYLARDTRVSNKPVVVKEMLDSFATEEERREAQAEFQAEAATMAALNFANIPSITDFFTEGRRNFLVQDFVAGQDLQKMLDSASGKPLSEKRVMPWISQVLGALEYMAAQDPQVVHRDIKPANILVDPANQAWLVDFGVASQHFHPGSTGALRAGQQQSTPLGTPGYAPPEQFSGHETVLSDIFALGATMHHLLTGRDPRQFTDPQQLWVYPPARQLNPHLSERAARIITRATQKEAAKRYASATAMKKEVDLIVHPPGAFSTKRGKAAALLIMLVLLVIAVLGSFIYTRQQLLLPATGYVSEGAVAFDVDTSARKATAQDVVAWAAAKKQASIDAKNGKITQAANGYAAATTNDQTDAESWIYRENLAAAQSGKQTYRVAVGGSFSGANAATGRQILQGVYTAQREINEAGGVDGHLVTLVLADDQSAKDGAVQSAQKIAGQDNVLAMVGYRTSTRTAAALPILEKAGVSLVTPTATNSKLGPSPYFFRVCPNDEYQGAQAARYMLRTLLKGKPNPLIAVFSDPNDTYSDGLATIVSPVAHFEGARVVNESYTIGTTVDFTPQATDALSQKVDLIYFAGYAHEALLLAQALDNLKAPQSLHIMSDDGFYNPSEFIALAGHKARFVFTGFFYPDQAGLVSSPTARQVIDAMTARYSAIFHRAGTPLGGYGSSRVTAGSALSYDALRVIARALEVVSRATGGQPTRQRVRDALAAIGNGSPPYQGATGRIAFDKNGDPMNKALLVMRLDANGRTRMNGFLGAFQ